jgi:hypothetical protein
LKRCSSIRYRLGTGEHDPKQSRRVRSVRTLPVKAARDDVPGAGSEYEHNIGSHLLRPITRIAFSG